MTENGNKQMKEVKDYDREAVEGSRNGNKGEDVKGIARSGYWEGPYTVVTTKLSFTEFDKGRRRKLIFFK